ncbi:hypothetical protein PVAG01_02213 [Phlyctema vagabunda]|uniref:PhoD-like phosphatase domain-containing protein n=1 Tax=Phlyctema vagabunda TaxID=108571 RepID=A0ABR4PQL8_9HELO
MATPYWGKLPPPNVARGSSARHDDEAHPKLSIITKGDNYTPRNSSQSQSRQNRISTQTMATTSTQSPFVSPVASNFAGDGLAPRPTSYQYGAPYPSSQLDANKDYLDKRRKRESRNRDHVYEDTAAGPPPPAAPDVPRAGPPLSYKQPQAELATRSSSTRRSGRRGAEDNHQAEPNWYRLDDPANGERDRGGQRVSNGKSVSRSATVDSRRDRKESNQRRGSLSEAEEKRRREWAPERSPLQRLELTLGSITKEEKRARAEEAESLAREGKTIPGGVRPNENSVRFRNRPVAVKPSEEIDPRHEPDANVSRRVSNTGKERSQRTGTVPSAKPVVKIASDDQASDYEPPRENSNLGQRLDQDSMPQRASSGRNKHGLPIAAAAAGAAAGTALGRSGSNRLKKEPPGDPWYNRRREAEQNSQDAAQRKQSKSTTHDPRETALNDQNRAPANSARVARPIDNLDFEPADSASSPMRRGSIRKVEQLTGSRVPGENMRDLPPVEPHVARSQSQRAPGRDVRTDLVTVNGIKYAVPPKTTSQHNDVQHPKHEHHHFSNILHHRHDDSGAGVYIPTKRLDEWKKGGVALLSGSLLDLDVNQVRTEAEKDKAWWEAGNTGKRRTSISKQRKAEAYDGEYDDSNGMIDPPEPSDEECQACLSDSLPTLRWTKTEILVTPRTRRYIGYIGESNRQKRRQRSNKSWLVASKVERKKTSASLFSRLSLRGRPGSKVQTKLDPNLSNLSRPYTLKDHSLTCMTRPIRVRSVTVPTRFKPPLFLKSGPLLRYCGLRRERLQNPSNRSSSAPTEREIWRGSIMIVTQDAKSSYELAPTLRLFLQPMDLLPPPPAQVDGTMDDLPQEYIDPIAGLPKLGRDGRTLYIRPVEHLEEEKDLSRVEADEGLFEMHKSNLDGTPETKPNPSNRTDKPKLDGEKAGKYKEVRGFRLHAERGVTFWRFNIEIELRSTQQRIAYRINRGPATGFWVPARDQAMNIMFHSCNGFSMSVNPDQLSGPDPMWRDVLNTHQTRPFHVMLGGGDQIYNDAVMEQTTLFKAWLDHDQKKSIHAVPKERVLFSPEMQDELENFYLERYSMWFSQGLFSVANSQIPMINIYDDHDIIDGFGSYPDHYMSCPVMSGLGSVAFKYYMLFQHQSSIDEGEETESSWLLGTQPGPYIPELSRSIFTHLGRSIAFLGLDCRTERMRDEVVSHESYDKIFARLEKDIIKGVTKHLIVLLGVPIAYPRTVWLENILTSRMFEPVKALGRAGILGKGLLNNFDGGVEVLDDLDDHWTAKNHKEERNRFIQELQDLAAIKSVRVTILGGDVHLGAIGQFYSNPKLKIPKDRDFRYMPNVISSAIVNTPPPDMLADVLNKRNKVHHLDDETDEDMIPIFGHDVTGKTRNNKRLLNRRNWCSIREYNPELTPPPTPSTPSEERSPSPPPRRGILRRLSTSRGPSYRPDAAAPPLSNPGGFFSRRPSFTSRRSSTDSQRPGTITRTLSLSRKDFMPGNIFRKKSRRANSGGINGYGSETESDFSYEDPQPPRSGLRGGSGGPDDDYFSQQRPGREVVNPVDQATTSVAGGPPQPGGLVRTQFHRTPTGLSEKQRSGAGDGRYDINLEGGLDICLNVEVNQKDPAGITMPYRLLVPRLWYSEDDEAESFRSRKNTGLSRLMSFKRKD